MLPPSTQYSFDACFASPTQHGATVVARRERFNVLDWEEQVLCAVDLVVGVLDLLCIEMMQH